MNNRLSCNPTQCNEGFARLVAAAIFCFLTCSGAFAGDAPAWMHAQANVVLSTFDDKTDAVLLYSESNVTVLAPDKIKTTVRKAYKILRPNGRTHGLVRVNFNPERKIKSLHGWC